MSDQDENADDVAQAFVRMAHAEGHWQVPLSRG